MIQTKKESDMLFNNKEALQLIYAVDENLRRQWEKVNLSCESLESVCEETLRADNVVERYRKRYRKRVWQSPLIMVGLTCVAAIIGSVGYLLNLQWVIFVAVAFVWASFVFCLWFMCVFETGDKQGLSEQRVKVGQDILARFTQSIVKIRSHPSEGQARLGEIITEQIVSSHLAQLACMVKKAREDFNLCRADLDMTIDDLMHAGEWVKRCEETFSTVFVSATDEFGLEFDRERIFKAVSEELTKAVPEQDAEGMVAESHEHQ